MVQSLIDNNEIFKVVYCDMIAQEKISDWRHDVNHEKFFLQADSIVELIFGIVEKKGFFQCRLYWLLRNK